MTRRRKEQKIGMMEKEAQRVVWEGAIPLQIHLHESEVTTLPSPPPALVPFVFYRIIIVLFKIRDFHG